MRYGLLLILGLSLLIVAFSVLFVVTREYETEFVDSVVLQGQWGSGAGEFGTDEQFTLGPPAFAVCRCGEKIAIADVVNDRVVVYDGRGSYHIELPVEGRLVGVGFAGDQISVLIDHSLYVLEDDVKKIVVDHTDGEVMHTNLINTPLGVTVQQEVLYGDRYARYSYVLLADGDGGYVLDRLGVSSVYPGASREILGHSGEAVYVGGDSIVASRNCERIPIRRYGNGDSKVMYAQSTEGLRQVLVLGADYRHRVYLKYDRIESIDIVRFAPVQEKSELVAPQFILHLQETDITGVQIDQSGNTYVSVANDNGYQITKWVPVRKRVGN